MIDPSGNLFDVGSFIASTCVGIIAGWVIGGISGYEIFMERSSKLKAGGYSIPDGFMALAIILGGYSYSVIMGGMGAINGMSTGSAILTSITMTMAAVAKSMDSVGMLKDVPVLRDIARILGQITAAANGDLDSFKRGDIVISASVSINISYGKNKEEYESPVKGDNSNSLINKNNNKNDSENNMDFVNFFKKLAKEIGSASLYYQDNPEILQAEMAQIYGLKNDMAFMAHTFDYDYAQSDYMDSKRTKWTYESQNEMSEALGWGYFNDNIAEGSSLCHAASLMEAHDLNMGDDRTLQEKTAFLEKALKDEIIDTTGYVGDAYKFVKLYAETYKTKVPVSYADSKVKGTVALYGVGRYNKKHSSVIMSGKTSPIHNPWTTTNYGNNNNYSPHAAWFKYNY